MSIATTPWGMSEQIKNLIRDNDSMSIVLEDAIDEMVELQFQVEEQTRRADKAEEVAKATEAVAIAALEMAKASSRMAELAVADADADYSISPDQELVYLTCIAELEDDVSLLEDEIKYLKGDLERLDRECKNATASAAISNRKYVAKSNECKELNATFEMVWAAQMRAIDLWQEGNPGNDLVWPDHTKLCVWLMDQFAAYQKFRVAR